tara:strand:- start:806 stop:1837 length:1032 start_codon:yes stop_codon:yes gene_type:complete
MANNKKKDGFGYGNLEATNTYDNAIVNDDETYVGLPVDKPIDEHETYIGKETKQQTDMNKISATKIGDEIRYLSNGVEGAGVVVKMNNSFITLFKEDGQFYDVHVNETFFVKDILINKTWDDMTPPERYELLYEAKMPSPRYVIKSWAELPKELKEVLQDIGIEKGKRGMDWNRMDSGVRREYADQHGTGTADWERLSSGDQKKLTSQGLHGAPKQSGGDKQAVPKPKKVGTHFGDVGKTDLEQQGHGAVAGNPYAPIATGTPIKADDGYEGKSRARKPQDKVEFQHEETKPKITKGEEDERQPLRGEFTYTETTKYKVKGVPETQAPTWGIKYVRKDEEDKQ